MSGIYLHIPFCKQACHYCDFHFSTSLQYKDRLIQALKTELQMRAGTMATQQIQTIYLGGGTPSLLSGDELQGVFETIYKHFNLAGQVEITLEANPDDLHDKKVSEFRHTPINRFSIGIQSFFEADLRWMNRAHTASEAESAIKRVQDAGYGNITCDLIYGYPLLSDDKWQSNMDRLIQYGVPHISAYSMTVEDKTALASFITKGKQNPMDEEQSARQFMALMHTLADVEYEQYEISNFAKDQQYSRHNTNYWMGVPYIGVGPSAHSFNGENRSWNVANNHSYMTAILEQNSLPSETEILREEDRINEYIMTSLRTKWGLDTGRFTTPLQRSHLNTMRHVLEPYLEDGSVFLNDTVYYLSDRGKLFADRIAADLFIVN